MEIFGRSALLRDVGFSIENYRVQFASSLLIIVRLKFLKHNKMSEKSTTDQVDNAIWSKHFPDLYWSFKPIDLSQGIVINQVNTNELVLTFYSGVYGAPDFAKQCIIREISGAKILLEHLAREEAVSLKYLKHHDFLAKHYGFYFEGNGQDQIRYVLVFQKYPHNWDYLRNLGDEEQKLKSVRQAMNALKIMQDRGLYHGSLSPVNLYLDTDLNLKIGNLLHSGLIGIMSNNFAWNLRGACLIDKTYVAPELRFALLCFQKNILIHPFNPLKADVFSLGACILTTIPNTQIFNELQGLESRAYSNEEINKSDICNTIRMRQNNLFTHVQESIVKLQEKIQGEINKCENEKVQFILMGSMDVYYENRCSYISLLNLLENIQPMGPRLLRIMPSIDSSTEDPEFQIYAETLKQFIGSLVSARPIHYTHDEDIMVFFSVIENILYRYEEKLNLAKRKQLFCAVGSPTNIYHGIQCFFHRFFKLLQDLSKIRMFLQDINQILPEQLSDYCINIFNKICHLNDIEKDLVVSGLQVVDLLNPRGWFYFFPRDTRALSYCEFYPFNSSPFLNDFNKFIECEFIKEELRSFLKCDADIQNVYDNEILPNIYLGNLFPSTAGFTSQNRRIFIKDYSRKSRDTSDSARGAIFIVLVHEISHFLRRLTCERREDWSRERITLEEGNSSESGESRFKLEKILFGSRINFINDAAARFLSAHTCMELEQFKAEFMRINVQDEGHTTRINRGPRGAFKGVRCPMRNSAF